jgi:CRISPR-associated protein Cmr2
MSYFHFTLGPVQGFVSQARRTRDFWAGSFLLSWLSGVAMVATEKMGGKITFPIPAEGYLDWIRGNGKGAIPRQGSIPNRFKASVPSDFDGKRVEQAVRDAWMQLAEHVWQQDLQAIASPATREVWDRQNATFWEISWAMTDVKDASNLLDRRKNWRNHLPPPEPGVKCVIMEGWQELSGVTAMRSDDNKERAAFWNKVRAIKPAGESDFADGEMLCALAFVKRRFARHFAGFVGRVLTRQAADENVGLKPDLQLKLQGWELDTGMPSVAYMAATRWLEKVVKHDNQEVVAQLLEVGQKLAGRDEWDVRIKCLDDAVKGKSFDRAYQQERRNLISLDGNVFFEHTRGNAKFYPNREDVKTFEKILNSLELSEKAPTPFYAVLMMDGDSLGTQMSSLENQEKIAKSLNKFTNAVAKAVHDNNGFLIYAGGDDVLALLPLEDALPCALACRNTYTDAFRGTGIATTLSGAVLYAYVKTALGEVLRQAHHVLDDVAKEGAGRDAIAIRVLKPGGDHLTWAQPWEIALDGSDKLKLESLIAAFQSANDKEGQFSSKFFYRMRERFTLLGDGFSEEQQIALLAADYIASEPAKRRDPVTDKLVKITIEEAKQIIAPLLNQCRQKVRVIGTDKLTWKSQAAKADAALLVRFLAHKGVETR